MVTTWDQSRPVKGFFSWDGNTLKERPDSSWKPKEALIWDKTDSTKFDYTIICIISYSRYPIILLFL